MNQITIRGLDPKLEKEIRRKARQSGKSLNRIILEMIFQNSEFGEWKRRMPAESLRKLAGGWSREEASAFLDRVKSCEQIDGVTWR